MFCAACIPQFVVLCTLQVLFGSQPAKPGLIFEPCSFSIFSRGLATSQVSLHLTAQSKTFNAVLLKYIMPLARFVSEILAPMQKVLCIARCLN